jgi:tRNA dimethylallyltransferase
LNTESYNCIVILGPTASGKTHLACLLAYHLNGEIISADSRQVYKELNIGTGKDLHEYTIEDHAIPYHLIDICDVNIPFYLHDFIRELRNSFNDIRSRNKLPIICGGTGLYLEALEKDHSYTQIPENESLREQLKNLSKNELAELLHSFGNTEQIKQTDSSSVKRLIRGIEIAAYLNEHSHPIQQTTLPYKPKYIGINISTDERNKRIDERLKHRLNNGLIEEVEALLQKGVSHERLQFLGLEYKFISLYLLGKLSKQELFNQLSTAIHQFAKRQMTWFRRMERKGIQIEWINHSSFSLEQLKQLLT